MTKKIVVGFVALAATLFVVAWLASPVLAVKGLISAAESGDEAELERRVDFPAFRQSLKDELGTRAARELDRRTGGLGGLGMLLAPSLIDSAVDTLVTAPAVAALVRTGRAPEAGDLMRERRSAPEPTPKNDGDDIHRAYSYRDLNTFVVRLTRADRPDDPVDLLLKRQGLFEWRLSGVDFPEGV